jgi:activator of HSP90 ATPase
VGAEMRTKNIRQSIIFKANPHEIYEILMDVDKHSKLTGSKVKIQRNVGSEFSIYDGDIQGVNLELVPDKKITQSWRYSDWPTGHYAKNIIRLNEVLDGTRLIFTQTGIPEEFYEDIKQGWQDYYWEPMKELLRK